MNCRVHRMLHQIVLGCVFAVLGPLGAFNVGASAQSYAFGRADFGTGASPAAVVTGDFNGDSKLDLATVNSVDNTVSILLGKPDGTFQPHLDLKVGSFPLALATGDFNGDGKLDLAVINSGDSTVSILRGNGNGTFQTAVSYAVGPFPSSVVSGDFRGDGKLDLAVGYDDGSVSILLGNGDGTFRAPAKLSGNPGNPAAVGDFNGDGRQDLVVTFGCSLPGGSEPPGSISILLANGDGTFRTSWHQDVACGLVSVAVGDFNGDGKLDLASQGSLLLGNGDGTFQAGSAYTTSENCSVFPSCWGSVVAGDFNGDGRLDLAAENTDFPTVSLLIGNGDGTFQATVEYTISAGPMIAGDFNGDGADDLAVIGYNPPNTLSVLLSGFGGKDSFAGVYYPTVPVDHYCTAGPTSTGDFNADGKLDLAVSYSCSCCAPEDYGVVVTLLGNGDGTFPVSPNLADVVGANPSSLAVEDFNKDGKPDLVVATSGCAPGLFPGCGPAGVSVLLGNGDGTFQTAVNYSAGLGPPSVAVGDFNGDGKLDLAVSNAGSDNVSVLLGNGDGTFQAAANYGAGSGPISVAVGGFNSDGKLDLAVANGISNNVTLLLGNGDGSFRPGAIYGVTSGLRSIVVGDFNGDGRLDLAVASGASNPEGVPVSVTVSVLLGNGNGSFQSPMTFSTGAPAVFPPSLSMAVTDLNGDGKLVYRFIKL